MESIKSNIISGFNEVIQSITGIEKQFPEQEHLVSFVTFNGSGIKVHIENQPIKGIRPIDERSYNPDSVTPLFDAIGMTVSKLKTYLKKEKNYNVLVTILTDGLENASKEYSGKQIKDLIENLKIDKWTFTYIGTDHDIEKIASSISIKNTLFFHRDEESIQKMFVAERDSRFGLYKDISEENSKKAKK